jgi:hypothetical protein
MSFEINDIYRASMNYTMDGQQCYNVMNFRNLTQASTPISIGQKMDTLHTHFLGYVQAFREFIPPAMQINNIVYSFVQGVGVARGWERSINLPGAGPAGAKLPGFAAAVINTSTGLYGRSRRGRVHVGGIRDDLTDVGRLNGAGLAALEPVRAAVAAMGTTGTQWRLVVYSRRIALGCPDCGPGGAPVPPAPTDAWADVESASISPILGTMYSRRIGVGS